MLRFKFRSVHIEAAAVHLPETQLTSAEVEDRFAPLYEKLGIPFGTLEKLSGIKNRLMWTKEIFPSQVATEAAKKALDRIGFSREHLKALFNCSVCRDYFEPATASLVHGRLGLGEGGMTMDISNACLGFSNGMLALANMIESGIVKAGVIVSGENVSSIIESSFSTMLKTVSTITRERMLRLLPSFTLGCGAVAMVLCHESIATQPHKFVAAVSRSASQHSDLCVGNGDFCAAEVAQGTTSFPLMETDSQKIISSAAKLGAAVWPELSELVGWTAADLSHIYCHQVGKQLGKAFFQEMGLSNEKEFTVYQRFGNQVSAALPTALVTGMNERGMKSGDKVLLTGFGSGLNAVFSSIVW